MAPNKFSAGACATKYSYSPDLPEHCIFFLPLTKDITQRKKISGQYFGFFIWSLFLPSPLPPHRVIFFGIFIDVIMVEVGYAGDLRCRERV